MANERNDIPLYTRLDGELVSHFRLKEFENVEGLAMVHPSVLLSLERVRRDLGALEGEPVGVRVTDAVRTAADLAHLARRLGWTDEGGLVSRASKHLSKYGGIAVDLVAYRVADGARVPQARVGMVCRRHFDFVKDDYLDGHVHADNRGARGGMGRG